MSRKTRLYNFLIDSSIFFIFVVLISLLVKDYLEKEKLRYFMIIVYYLYYFTFELFFGQTIGKMITKTKVYKKGSIEAPNFLAIFVRTLSRLIPLDFLSYFFAKNGIHDMLSKTELKTIINT